MFLGGVRGDFLGTKPPPGLARSHGGSTHFEDKDQLNLRENYEIELSVKKNLFGDFMRGKSPANLRQRRTYDS